MEVGGSGLTAGQIDVSSLANIREVHPDIDFEVSLENQDINVETRDVGTNTSEVNDEEGSDEEESEEEALERANIQLAMLKLSIEGIIQNFECIIDQDMRMISFMKSKLRDMTLESTRHYKQSSIKRFFSSQSS